MSTVVCSVPRCAATAEADAASSNASSSKETVKVRTGWPLWRCIKATVKLESIPPESRAPTGTSATVRAPTASDRRVLHDLDCLGIVAQGAGAGMLRQWRRWPTNTAPVRAGARVASQPRHMIRAPGPELGQAPVDAARSRDAAEAEVTRHGVAVDPRFERREGVERLQLRSEREDGTRPAVVERLLAESVPREVQPALAPVPGGEGEHALYPLQRAARGPSGRIQPPGPRCPTCPG